LCEVITEWEIPENKINAILTDNGSNMVKAFQDWLQVIQGDSEEEEQGNCQVILKQAHQRGVGQALQVKTQKKRMIRILNFVLVKQKGRL